MSSRDTRDSGTTRLLFLYKPILKANINITIVFNPAGAPADDIEITFTVKRKLKKKIYKITLSEKRHYSLLLQI